MAIIDRAVVINGVIVNVIVINENATEHEGKQLIAAPPNGGIGWLFDGEKFSPPQVKKDPA